MKQYAQSYYLAVLSIICIITACKTKNVENEPDVPIIEINLGEITDAITNDIVDSIYYVGLPHIDGNIPVSIDKIIVSDGLIYTADCRHGKIFAHEETTGKPKFAIDHRGAGPQDYGEIRSMTVNEKHILIIDNITHKLHFFDSKTGNYITSKKMPIVADDIEVLDNDKFIFATSYIKGTKLNIDQPKYRLFVTDNDLNIIDYIYGLADNEYDSVNQRTIFSQSPKGIIFSSASLNGFMIIDTADPRKQTKIKLPFNKSLSVDKPIDIDNLLQYQYLTTAPYMSKDNLYIQYSTGDGHVRQNIWSKQFNGLLSNSPTNLSKAILPVVGSTHDCFISTIDCHETYVAITNDGFTKASDDIVQILKDDCGIALVFYKMK